MQVRKATQEDWRRGLKECLEQFGPCHIYDNDVHEYMLARAEVGIATLVAVEGVKVVGTASYFTEPKLIHDGRPVGHIEDVATLPAHQRQGIAGELLKYIEKSCRNRQCYKLILNCSDEMIPFYEKFGFKRDGAGMRKNLA